MSRTGRKKEPKIRVPQISSLKKLREMFLEGYDYLSWVNRVALLDLAIEQSAIREGMRTKIRSFLDQESLSPSDESIVNIAKLEIHFAAYHSTEALLGLIFAFVYDVQLPWGWLTRYTPTEFADRVNELAEKGLSMFTADEAHGARVLFFNVQTEQPDIQIENSIQFAAGYVKALAGEFRDRTDYNCYKHGLRTLTPRDFKPKLGLLAWDEIATTYLEIGKPKKDRGELVRDLDVVTKAIDYERSKRIIATNTLLIHNLFEIKKAQTFGRDRVNLHLFASEVRVDDVLNPSKTGNILKTFRWSPNGRFSIRFMSDKKLKLV